MSHNTSIRLETQGLGLGPAGAVLTEMRAAYGNPMIAIGRGLNNLISRLTAETRDSVSIELQFDENDGIGAFEQYRFMKSGKKVEFYVEYNSGSEGHDFDREVDHKFIAIQQFMNRAFAVIEMASVDSDHVCTAGMSLMIRQFLDQAAAFAQKHSIASDDDGTTIGLWFKNDREKVIGMMGIHFPGLKVKA